MEAYLKRLVFGFLSGAICLSSVAAAQDVATVQVAVNEVQAFVGESRQSVVAGDKVAFDTKIITGSLSTNLDLFNDGTTIVIEANSEVTFDEFVYDFYTGAGKMSVNLARGVLCFVSGEMKKANVNVTTPISIVGIRGTQFVLGHTPGISSTMIVEEGETTFANRAGVSVVVPAGSASTIEEDGGNPTPAAPPSPSQSAVAASVNVTASTVAAPATTMSTVATAVAAWTATTASSASSIGAAKSVQTQCHPLRHSWLPMLPRWKTVQDTKVGQRLQC